MLVLGTSLSGRARNSEYILVEANTLFGRPDIEIVDINDDGHIVANQRIEHNWTIPLHRDRTLIHELALLPDQGWAEVAAINDAGLIIGANYNFSFTATGTLWNSSQPSTTFALTGINGIPTALNEQGDMAGWVVDPSIPQGAPRNRWGFTWFDDSLTEFNNNFEDTRLNAINANRVVVGYSQVSSSQPNLPLRREDSSNRNFGSAGNAHDINDAGQITSSIGGHAFRYIRVNDRDELEDLNPPEATTSSGTQIAVDGTVFGSADFPGEACHAMILDGANIVALAGITIGDDQAQLARVHALNAVGWLAVAAPFDTVTPHYLLVPRTAARSTFANLSVRAQLDSDQILIIGTATVGGSRTVLTRSIGPGLADYLTDGFAVAGNPTIAVFDAESQQIATNDDWVSTGPTVDAIATAQAFPIDPGSTDAAIAVDIDGLTSVHANNTGETGAEIVELFDLDQSDPARRLVNLSARYEVGTGDNILIGGFILSGMGTQDGAVPRHRARPSYLWHRRFPD